MKKTIVSLIALMLLSACESHEPNDVSVPRASSFAVEQGYTELQLVQRSTLCARNRGNRNYGPTFDGVKDGQLHRFTVCETVQLIHGWGENDPMRVGYPRVERIERILNINVHRAEQP